MSQPANMKFDDGVVSCSPEVFEQQIEFLSINRNLVTMDQVADAFTGRSVLPKMPALITFDDGYADNYTNAFPILKKYRAPACFFLPSRRFSTRLLEWWDNLAYAVKSAAPGRYSLLIDGSSVVLDLNGVDSRNRASADLIERAKSSRVVTEDLFSALGVLPPTESEQSDQIMSDEQVFEILSEDGYSIGGHSVSHSILANLSSDQQLYEIVQSKKELQDRFQCVVRAFAYPVGRREHYSAVSIEAVETANFDCAFNFRQNALDVNMSQTNRFDIDRISLPRFMGGIVRARCSGFFLI